jgi:hypothetical protein
MTMYVLIEHKPEGRVTASLIGWPGITGEAGTEDEAVDSLRRSLTTQLRDAKIVPFEVAVDQPWLQTAGMFKGDPFTHELDEVIAQYRRERDAEELSPTTQDHAA